MKSCPACGSTKFRENPMTKERVCKRCRYTNMPTEKINEMLEFNSD